MNDFLKKLMDQVRTLWGKWSWVQRLTLIGVAVVTVAAVILMIGLSASPSRVAIIGAAMKDQQAVLAITSRLDQEGIPYTSTEDGHIYVNDRKTAERARAILFRENLIPSGTDPFAIFDVERW